MLSKASAKALEFNPVMRVSHLGHHHVRRGSYVVLECFYMTAFCSRGTARNGMSLDIPMYMILGCNPVISLQCKKKLRHVKTFLQEMFM